MIESPQPQSAKPVAEQQEKQLVLFGRFMLPDMTEHPCQVTRATHLGAAFLTELDVPAGVKIVAYIDEIGRVEAQVADTLPGGFGVRFYMTEARQKKFNDRLAWLKAKQQDGSLEQREHKRFEPSSSTSHITLPDGRVYPCEVIDISLSGAAVTTEVMPALGTYVMLGKMRGRVVRYINGGVAIEFAKQLDSASLAKKV